MAAYAIEGFRETCIKVKIVSLAYMASTQSFKKSSSASFVDLFFSKTELPTHQEVITLQVSSQPVNNSLFNKLGEYRKDGY